MVKIKFLSFLLFYGIELLFHLIIAYVFYLIHCVKNPQISYDNDIFSTILGVIVYINVFRLIGGEIIIKALLEYWNISRWYKACLSLIICLIFVLIVEYHSNNRVISVDFDFIFHPSFGWIFHLPIAVILTNVLRIILDKEIMSKS